jgi:hypothetical protein
LRQEELSRFQPMAQPVPWLASGVGIAGTLYCDGGKSIVCTQRSENETFRSNEFDTSVVEGIAPTRDKDLQENGLIYPELVLRRAFKGELGSPIEDIESYIYGYGVDLEYYQWNFLGFGVTNISFEEVVAHWQMADEKFETRQLLRVPADPTSVARFCSDHRIWSCGIASLYTSLIKMGHSERDVFKSFTAVFS